MNDDIYSVKQSTDYLNDKVNKRITDILNEYSDLLFGMPPSIDKDGNPISGKRPDFTRLTKLISMYR